MAFVGKIISKDFQRYWPMAQDLTTWWPKIKPGGLMCLGMWPNGGDDSMGLGPPSWPCAKSWKDVGLGVPAIFRAKLYGFG